MTTRRHIEKMGPEEREYFEERAAILEYNAEMKRDEAERLAYRLTMRRFDRECFVTRDGKQG